MKRIAFLCVVVLAFSCTDNNKIPSGIIPKEKMQSLMWDMVQADRFNNFYVITVLDSSKIDSAVFRLYDEVFQLHHTNKDEFLKSYKFYLSRPDLTKVMFDSIAIQAERQRADVYKMNRRDSARLKKMDSLRLNRKDSIKLNIKGAVKLNRIDSIRLNRKNLLKLKLKDSIKLNRKDSTGKKIMPTRFKRHE